LFSRSWVSGPRAPDDLEGRVDRLAELDRRARQWLAQGRPPYERTTPLHVLLDLMGRPFRLGSPPGEHDWLKAKNPHHRYALALYCADPLTNVPRGTDLVDALRVEPVAIVRRALAVAIGRRTPLPGLAVVTELGHQIPEVVYLVASAGKRLDLLGENRPSVGGTLELAHRVTLIEEQQDLGIRRSAVGALMVRLLGEGTPAKELAGAYETGQEPPDLSFLNDLPESRLRTAIKDASPEESGGLGTFDHLKTIGRIDDLYLLLRQAQFYKERSMLLLPANPTAPAGT